MDRRAFLTTIGATTAMALAGCTGEDSYLYEGYDRADLIPGLQVLPDGWQEAEDDSDREFEFFRNEDNTKSAGFDAEVHDTSAKAADALKKLRSQYMDNRDYELGERSFWTEYDDTLAVVAWQHSNALGMVVATGQQGTGFVPDRETAFDTAEKTLDFWKNEL